MHFILHFDQDEDWAGFGAGVPRANYNAITKSFEAVFGRLGNVSLVYDPKLEVDPLYDHLRAFGETPVFVCFSLPHKVPPGLRCPTVVAFGWAYGVLPTGPRSKPTWRSALAACGKAIAFSETTAGAVRAMMGPEFPVVAIAPVIEDRSVAGHKTKARSSEPVEICLRGIVIDTRAMGLSADLLVPVVRPELESQTIAIAHRVRNVVRRTFAWNSPWNRSPKGTDAESVDIPPRSRLLLG